MPTEHKRNPIAEIKASILRNSNGNPEDLPGWRRLDQIIAAYLEIDKLESESILRPELERHVIVSLASVVQAASRHALSEIIDQKEFRGDVLPELVNAKMTIAIARELKDSNFSFGQLISHFMPLSSFSLISTSLKQVCDRDLDSILKKYLENHKDYISENVGFQLTKIRKGLVALFEFRNIFAHEEGLETTVDDMELYESIRVTMMLVTALGLLRAEYM